MVPKPVDFILWLYLENILKSLKLASLVHASLDEIQKVVFGVVVFEILNYPKNC